MVALNFFQFSRPPHLQLQLQFVLEINESSLFCSSEDALYQSFQSRCSLEFVQPLPPYLLYTPVSQHLHYHELVSCKMARVLTTLCSLHTLSTKFCLLWYSANDTCVILWRPVRHKRQNMHIYAIGQLGCSAGPLPTSKIKFVHSLCSRFIFLGNNMYQEQG